VSDAPQNVGPSASTDTHTAWSSYVEGLISKAFSSARKNPANNFRHLQGRYTFTVHCTIKQPNNKIIKACAPIIQHELAQYSRVDKPIMIFALGAKTLKALGFKFGRYTDIQGRFLTSTFMGRPLYAFAALSAKQLPTRTGYFEVLTQHVNIFLNAVKAVQQGLAVDTMLPIEDLTKKYRYPKTIQEVQRLVDTINNYAVSGVMPDKHVISLDTETNTIHPYRKHLKILSLTVAWGKGLAASIPIEHEESKWSLEDVRPMITRLLQSKKPKVMHNAKFDLQVLHCKGFDVRNVAWDTMIGEHLISEDKKGNYGLKGLTDVYLPNYAGYDDDLTAIKDNLNLKKKQQTTVKRKVSALELKLNDDVGFSKIPLRILNVYGAIDADVTRQLCVIQRERMLQEDIGIYNKRKNLARSKYFKTVAKKPCENKAPLAHIMRTRSMPVTRVLADMETYGFPVDRNYTSKLTLELEHEIFNLHIQLREMTQNKDFNPNSSPQIQKILFAVGYKHPETGEIIAYGNKLDPDDIPKTASGQISVNKAFLTFLKNSHTCIFADTLLQYRALSKAHDTFLTNIELRSREDGRMHTTFHITGTGTGRLSSSGENLQNVPFKVRNHNIKKVFIPSDRENNVIVNADAKAAEVRIYAGYSKDANLIEALNNGMDPHSFFGDKVYQPKNALAGIKNKEEQTALLTAMGTDLKHAWDYEDFQNRESIGGTYGAHLDKLRKNIKRVVFGILYGAGKYNIAKIVSISQKQADALINVLFKMFPTIPTYISQTKEQVKYLGMVETYVGRRRRFNLAGMTFGQRAKANRQAVNFKVQSTASEIVMDVMCSLDGPLRELGARLMLTVHDSMVIDFPKKNLNQLKDLIHYYGVEQVAKNYKWLPVPFQWDIEVGPSYGELTSLDNYLKNQASKPTHTETEDLDLIENIATMIG